MENTMSAFRHAIHLGVDMIETDVRISKDGHLFLMHNLDLADQSDGSGRMQDHTYREIRSMNTAVRAVPADDFEAPSFEPVALLEELLDLASEHPDLMLNIEIKDKPSEADEDLVFACAEKTAAMLARYGLGQRTWINSFTGNVLERVYSMHGDSFHYHGFYPWHIMGSMETNPWDICDVACLLNWTRKDDGSLLKRTTVPCPSEWYRSLLEKGIMPLTIPFYKDMQAYDDAISYGSRILMADDPKTMLSYVRGKGLHGL